MITLNVSAHRPQNHLDRKLESRRLAKEHTVRFGLSDQRLQHLFRRATKPEHGCRKRVVVSNGMREPLAGLTIWLEKGYAYVVSFPFRLRRPIELNDQLPSKPEAARPYCV
ncbi:hypothetical protein [Ideonella sp. BN130291]|uniref:hypothetical protein n=1 Tax=Ideonella sp. BN130291 TaxID=3112940 RepID=UPI002E259DE6|nr:hypothetical protein [Ideonella sp. BN130291]